MKKFLSVLLLLLPTVFAGHFYVKEAGVSGKLGPKLANGFQFCPSDFSARGFSVLCIPAVQQNELIAKVYINGKYRKSDRRSPFSIAGDNRILDFFGAWYSPPPTAKIGCAIYDASHNLLEEFSVSGHFSCGNIAYEAGSSAQLALPRPLSIDSAYCVAKNAISHFNVRPADWVPKGTSLTYRPLDSCAKCTHPWKTANLQYKFRVPVKSHYAVTMVSTTFHPTDHNDCWMMFDSFSLHGFNKVTKEYRTITDKRSHIKVFQNKASRATSAFSVDHNPHSISTTQELIPGIDYTLTVGARSTQFQFDKLVLFPCSGRTCWGYSDYFLKFAKLCSA